MVILPSRRCFTYLVIASTVEKHPKTRIHALCTLSSRSIDMRTHTCGQDQERELSKKPKVEGTKGRNGACKYDLNGSIDYCRDKGDDQNMQNLSIRVSVAIHPDCHRDRGQAAFSTHISYTEFFETSSSQCDTIVCKPLPTIQHNSGVVTVPFTSAQESR